VIYELIREPAFTKAASRFLDDPMFAELLAHVDTLAHDPRPEGCVPWGDVYRLRVGRYRVMYGIKDKTIHLINLGRAAPS
jgi:mRNA-degrading endonuclease RelE of RelBE toxin-antitoxin system